MYVEVFSHRTYSGISVFDALIVDLNQLVHIDPNLSFPSVYDNFDRCSILDEIDRVFHLDEE